MADNIPSNRRPADDDLSEIDDDLRDVGDDASRAADRAGDEVDDAAWRAKEGAASVGHKVSDALEDLIPGDSDQDGH
jgi:hypothetical protein